MMVATGSGEQPNSKRPETIEVPGKEPARIDWLTEHLGCALLPHPTLIGQAALVIVQSNPSNPAQCKVVGPQSQEMALLIGVLIQFGADYRDLANRVDALELGVRLVR